MAKKKRKKEGSRRGRPGGVNWLKWCKGLARKREVLVLASLLNRDRKFIASSLMELWEWCDDNLDDVSFDGEDAIVSLGSVENARASIDEHGGIKGLADALSEPGVDWLDLGNGTNVRFKRFKRNNGSTAKARASEQRKKAIQRRQSCPDDMGTPVPSSYMPNKSKSKSKNDHAIANETAFVPGIDRGVQGGKILAGDAAAVSAVSQSDTNLSSGNLPATRESVPPAASREARLPAEPAPDPGLEREPIPHGFADRCWEFRGILGVYDRPDQHGFLAKLAYADCMGFPWPRPILSFVGRAKKADSPAAFLTTALKAELKERWADFQDQYPTYSHCLWALAEVDGGRRKEGE